MSHSPYVNSSGGSSFLATYAQYPSFLEVAMRASSPAAPLSG
eukprot:CAMPEP_0206168794 /NCGR_PEP_ID=MMETSP1474-20131121/33464_1 /ASSEMBLY_ACC=CAM_ASM_001110 /TAXON_ID=97495 /ORGANISM="Imantonia sp., Strain RCC918" /LENGTH=41 /DNA_ID= /DNA_START= /DNA_END= /DNA_ORIENTATION=